MHANEYDYSSVGDLSELKQFVKKQLEIAEDHKRNWTKNRCKMSRNVQNFATKFSEFLESYSGIVEVVKGADQQYGGLAYGTLSLFFIVGLNKSRHETVIEETMDILHSNLPRMEAFLEIYPSEKLESLVAELYAEVIDFLRKAVKYHQRSGYLRVWHIISHPPKFGLNVDVGRIMCKINEVKEESVIKLNESVRDIERQVKDMQKEQSDIKSDVLVVKRDGRIIKSDVRTVESNVSKIQQHQVHTCLSELQVLLLPTWTTHNSHEKQLASYRGLLATTFDNDSIQATLSDLEGKTEYLQWRANKYSCILRLSGHTSTEPTGLCWLSNTVPGLVEKLRLEGQHVVFHLTQRQHWMQDDVPVQEIVSSIIYQLLQLKPQTLHDRKWFDELHRRLKRDAWCTDLTLLCKTLVMVLEEFEVTNIILDRIDRGMCSGRSPRFIERLLEALSASTCNTRILLVTNPATGLDWELDLSDDTKKKCMYLEIAQWDQEVITPRRRKRH
ncbi:MAG: hypothetical protein Q9217_004724 [Psora testacea]